MTTGGTAAAFSAFVVAALTMALLMFGLSVGIALAQEQVVSALRARTQTVKRWGGYILIMVGIWLWALTLWADFFTSIFPV